MPSQPPHAGPDAPPQYSHDGRWFWTGTRWIPAADVFLPRLATVPAAPAPARRRPPWRVWISAALIVLIVAAVATGALVSRPRTRPAPGPAAGRIFALPFTDRVGSAAVRGTLDVQGVTENLNGVIDFTPDRAMHVTLGVGGAYIGENLDSGGIDYQTERPGGPWDEATPVSRIDGVLGWAGGPPPPGLRVVGQQVVAGERAWHLRSAAGADWWIGARTGHPLRFAYRNQDWSLGLVFEGFGRAPAIMAPPRSNVSTLPILGVPRKVVTAPQMSMEVKAVQASPRGLRAPPTGYRYQALSLSYRNDGRAPFMFENAFTLTGEHGAQYLPSDRVRLAPALPRHLVLQPGQMVSGWDVFVVSRGARKLTLRVGPQADQHDVDFLVSIPLS